MRLYLTGFGPFGDAEENPSALLVQALGLPHSILAVSYAAVDSFLDELDVNRFDGLLMLGVATRRAKITPELFGRNRRGTTAGVDEIALPGEIEREGPDAVEANLWTPAALSAILSIPNVEASRDAGDYLCNDIAYRAARRFPDKLVGFLHVPPLTELPFEVQLESVGQILATLGASQNGL